MTPHPVAADDSVQERLQATVDRLMELAETNGFAERRTEPRMRFMCPVTVRPVGTPHVTISALAIDLSSFGVGLVQREVLEEGEFDMSFHVGLKPPLCLRTRILWSAPQGEGWHICGGAFIDVADETAALEDELENALENAFKDDLREDGI